MPTFVPDPSVIAAFALGTLVLTFTPGPDMVLFLSRAINHGRLHGFAAMSGALTGLLVHTTLVAFGISILVTTAPAAFLALKIGGALYLIYLAYRALKDGGGLRLSTDERRRPKLVDSYLTGLGINLLNPKVILFFITFLPQFVAHDDPFATGKLFFLGIEFIVVAFPVVTAMVLAAHWLAALLTRSQWVERALNWSFAAVFASFAVAILALEGRG